MADPNLRDFYGRIARIEAMSRLGYGFEAAGTLGRSHYQQPRRRRRPVLGPVLIICASVIFIKALIHQGVGAASYEARVEQLWQAEGVEVLGAIIMQADPLTLRLSDAMGEMVRRLRP